MTKHAIRLVVVLAASGLCAWQVEAGTLDVGHQKQLFVDQRFIESSDSITLRMNPPHQTGERLVVVDQPLGAGRQHSRLWERAERGRTRRSPDPPLVRPLHRRGTAGTGLSGPLLRRVSRWYSLRKADPGSGGAERLPGEQSGHAHRSLPDDGGRGIRSSGHQPGLSPREALQVLVEALHAARHPQGRQRLLVFG